MLQQDHQTPDRQATPTPQFQVNIALCLLLGLALIVAPAACTVGSTTCQSNSECTATGSCQQGQCATCTSDAQCDVGQICKVGACVSNSGTSDASVSDSAGTSDSQTTDKSTPPDTPKVTDQPGQDQTGQDQVGQDDPTQETPGDTSSQDQGACKAGTSRSCYGGSAKQEGEGVCKAGTQSCNDEGLWGACLGEVTPSPERCGDALDNDCDGKIDEADAGCQCKPGEQKPCGSSEGACKQGTLACDTKGTWGECLGEIKPSTETCDGKDNDCDGKIDEEWPEIGSTCTSGEGACKAQGKHVCRTDNVGTECNAKPGGPTIEVCDNKDNDCNGQIDEALQRECYKGTAATKNKGECKAGTQECSAGIWGTCKGQILPATEKCDGKDNDCDGQTDEGCTCTTGAKRTCGTSTGTCKTGSQTCIAGKWDTCTGEVKPATELCDGLDNDCDGQTDENFSSKGKACSVGVGACVRAGTFVCNASKTKLQCNAKAGVSTKEVCDKKDNDCDGQVDEGLTRSCYTGTSGTNGVGPCKGGTQSCSAGNWGACSGQIVPTSEKCDGKDNDCDGYIDENWSNKGKSCSSGLGECKRTGVYVCKSSGSTTTCNANPGAPKTEVCNSKDDNCDGTVDNGNFGTCSFGTCIGSNRCVNGAISCFIPDRSCCKQGQICP